MKRSSRRAFVLLGLATFAVVAIGYRYCHAGQAVTVGTRIPEKRRVSMDQIDHAAWDGLLQKYVNSAGMVDYASWKATPEDRAALEQYLNHLSSASLSQKAHRDAQLAFWINAYNAVTVEGILRVYPTTSIRNHTAKLAGYNIWQDLHLLVDGRSLSLEHIEHEVLRKMDEPRIHFAIVCASIGCPRLLSRAYTSENLDEQLTVNAKAFFADPEKFKYDTKRGMIEVSPILKWFDGDFGRNQTEQMRTIARFLPDESAKRLAESGRARVSYLDYDWGLNEQSNSRTGASR